MAAEHPHTRLRVIRAGIDTYQQPVVYMHRDCAVCRAEGFKALTRVRMTVGDRQVTATLIEDGNVLAPADGRVLSVPVRLGAVVMPGEPVATITGGGVYLRLAIPERHAMGLTLGAAVDVEGGSGKIEKIYPQIEQGRVIVDVAVDGLSDSFIGQRVMVRVPVDTRQVLAVPQAAIVQRAGLDLVRIKAPEGEVEVTVIPGAEVAGPDGPLREILTGLRAGDTVIVP